MGSLLRGCILVVAVWGLSVGLRAEDGGPTAPRTVAEARAAGATTAELLALVEGWIVAAEEDAPELVGWIKDRDELRADVNRARVSDLRVAAEAASNPEVAAERLREALTLIRAVNRSAVSDEKKDLELERRLERQLVWYEVRPLADEVERTLARAREAKGAEAETYLKQARELQLELNQRFPSASQASEARVQRIDAELAAWVRAGREAELDAMLQQAEAAVRVGGTEAVEAVEAALAEADRLRVNLDRGRPLDEVTARQAAFARRVQGVRAWPFLQRAAVREAEAAEHLRSGRTEQAAELIAAAMAEVEEAAREYPDGAQLEPGLRARLAYLAPRRARLGELQKQFTDLLLPVPGRPGLWMMRVEMPQALHERVASLNPSRLSGVNRPVESVSWVDAQVVAERLGWILGHTVRLPELAEWRAALGGGAQAGWLAANSEGQVREVATLPANAAGFHDLLGNVAEWLWVGERTGPNAALAPVVGGSVADVEAAVWLTPVRELSRTRRDRLVGYRLVVERK